MKDYTVIELENFNSDQTLETIKKLYVEEPGLNYAALPLFVIYYNPLDYPGKYVCRPWLVQRGKDAEPLKYCIVKDTLKEIRAALPPYLHGIPRDQSDDPAIIETWI